MSEPSKNSAAVGDAAAATTPAARPRPAVKGWCPGAYRPMESGDGLIVRVRPRLARLTAAQALGLCDAAPAFGSGVIDLTSRANLQLRGVRADSHPALLERLGTLGLLDADPALESRRNVLIDPLWRAGDVAPALADELVSRLNETPPLPAKFGFAVDPGDVRRLVDASADIRVERGASGGLILRADGAPGGRPVTAERAVDEALRLAHWFVETGGAASGRMARHIVGRGLPDFAATIEPPAAAAGPVLPGATTWGPALGVAFGRIDAAALKRVLTRSGAVALRLSHARTFILEGGALDGGGDEFLTDPDDPLLQADACAGLPFCPSSTVTTRSLARALAAKIGGRLHVSGCAKGCARAAPAAVTLTGRNGRFDLVLNGAAWDRPTETGLTPETLSVRYGAA